MLLVHPNLALVEKTYSVAHQKPILWRMGGAPQNSRHKISYSVAHHLVRHRIVAILWRTQSGAPQNNYSVAPPTHHAPQNSSGCATELLCRIVPVYYQNTNTSIIPEYMYISYLHRYNRNRDIFSQIHISKQTHY